MNHNITESGKYYIEPTHLYNNLFRYNTHIPVASEVLDLISSQKHIDINARLIVLPDRAVYLEKWRVENPYYFDNCGIS